MSEETKSPLAISLARYVTLSYKLLSLRPPGHPDRSTSLYNFANVVLTQYEQLGRMEYLEDVITVEQACVP